MTIPCPVCKGKKTLAVVGTPSQVTCPRCSGKGEIHDETSHREDLAKAQILRLLASCKL